MRRGLCLAGVAANGGQRLEPQSWCDESLGLGPRLPSGLVPARPRSRDTPRVAPLTTRSHTTASDTTCTHTLVTVDGSICETTIDAAGHQHTTDPLRRVQVRRTRSRAAGYRFTIGVEIPCAAGDFTCWITVHPHADHLRLLPPTDPHFDRLYGLRNDSESNNQAYKRTLPHRRAAGLGWQRQLLDAVGWAILVNSRAHAIHGPTDAHPARPQGRPHVSPLDDLLPGTPPAGPPPRLGPRLLLHAAARFHDLADTLHRRAHDA